MTAGETSTVRVSSDAASLALDEARALLAMQAPVPSLVANIIHQDTKVLQQQQAHVRFELQRVILGQQGTDTRTLTNARPVT